MTITPREAVFDAAWERVKAVTGWKKQSELAAFLGIKAPNVSGAKDRGTFPYDWARKLSLAYAVNAEWLLSGEGPKGMTTEAECEGSPLSEPEAERYRVTRVFQPVEATPVEQRALQRAIELVETAASGATPEAKARAIMAILAALEVVKKKEK